MATRTLKKLGPRHEMAAMLRAQGESWADIAKALRVNESVARRWAMSPAFREAVERYREEAKELARGEIFRRVQDAAHKLGVLLDADSEHVQLGAAREILDRAGVAPPGGDRQHVGPVIMVQLHGQFGGAPREGNET